MRARRAAVKLSIGAAALGVLAWGLTFVKDAGEQLSCEGWNTGEFFEAATGDDVVRCLEDGANIEARQAARGVVPRGCGGRWANWKPCSAAARPVWGYSLSTPNPPTILPTAPWTAVKVPVATVGLPGGAGSRAGRLLLLSS